MKYHPSFLLSVSLVGSLSAAFIPDDPYFAPFDITGTQGSGQWHLINNMPIEEFVNAGLDAGLEDAWNNGWTGAGVTIAIIDNGMQGDHPDLNPGFLNAYSWGFGKTQAENLTEMYRGSPVVAGIENDSHGTPVGGVAAARGGNEIGVTGAAPMANLASLRYLEADDPGGRNDSQMQAAAILYQGQLDTNGNPDPYAAPTWSSVPVRVKNHSYGPDVGYVLFDDFQLVGDAIKTSAANGVLHVWSAGNERMTGTNPWPTADAGKVFELSLPENIVVGAMGADGEFSFYSSYGPNLTVTAPSSGIEGFGVTTTDRTTASEGDNRDPFNPDEPFDFPDGYNYTSDFGGTSSASPLVAGVMALGVEANPNMNHRMAKHLLARTSRLIDADDASDTGGWIVNAGGYAFNNNYGFGLIDAGAFTDAAARVDTLTPQTVYEGSEITVNQSFAAEGDNTITETFSVSVDPTVWQPLEHVLIELTVIGLETDWVTYFDDKIGTILGDLSGWLTSPSGTRNQLFYDDRDIPLDEWEENRDYEDDPQRPADALNWQFLSNAYWGEDIEGDWIFELINGTTNPLDDPLDAVWESFSFSAGMGSLTLVPEPASFATFLVLTTLPLLLRRRIVRRK